MAFTKTNYTELRSKLTRIKKLKDVQDRLNKLLNTVDSEVAIVEKDMAQLGSADTLINSDTIAEVTGMKNKLKNGAKNIRDTHKIFLTGLDGTEGDV